MKCWVGISMDVAAHVAPLKAANLVPADASWRTLAEKLTYDEAVVLEYSERRECGPLCRGAGRAEEAPDRHLGSVISGAACPANPRPCNPQPDTDQLKSRRYEGVEHPHARAKSGDNRSVP